MDSDTTESSMNSIIDSKTKFKTIKVSDPSQFLTAIQESVMNKTVLISYLVFPSFYLFGSTKTNIIRMPSKEDIQHGPLGGLEHLVVGYDTRHVKLLKHSAKRSYFYLPIEYLTGKWKDIPYVGDLIICEEEPPSPEEGG